MSEHVRLEMNEDDDQDDNNDKSNAIRIKHEPIVSINTIFECINYSTWLCLNILVVIWYDDNKFKRADVFWAIFAFSYFSTLQGFQNRMIAKILFEIAQYILYLYFCNWEDIPLIIFSILLFLMFLCILLPSLIYKFCLNQKSQLIHQHIHSSTDEYSFLQSMQWFNGFEFLLIFTTVPLFYYNQDLLFGEMWFAQIVVIELWYHKIMDIYLYIFRDCNVRILMDDIVNRYDPDGSGLCDKQLLQNELNRPIKEYKYDIIIMNLIPITYHLFLLILLVIYLIIYNENELTSYESSYSVILIITITFVFGWYIYLLYIAEVRRGKKTLQEIFDEAKVNPQLSDLYGTWIIDNIKHPITSFTLKKENIIAVDDCEQHKLGCCGLEDIYASPIVGAIQLYKNESIFRNKNGPFYFKFIKEDGYKFILHKNGIIKFVPVGDSLIHKLMLARSDSQGWWDLIKNIKHANKYSCFCLGILTKENQIKRYNRWNSDLDYFYTASTEQ